MLTKDEARALVEKAIADANLDIETTVLEEETLSHEWGWVFFYQSTEFLETGCPSAQLLGNAPFIVNRTTGEIVPTGTALPIEEYIKSYSASLHVGARGDA